MKNSEKAVEHNYRKKIKILIVDDDKLSRKMLSFNFKKLYPSSEIHLFEDPVDALDFYRDNYNDINIVILDMILPNMTGLELSRKIKEINKSERIILVSAYSIDAMIGKEGSDTVEFFLSKNQMDPSLKNFSHLLDFYVKKILWIKEMQIKHQKAKKELRANEVKIRTIVKSIGEAIISTTVSPELTIVFVNQEACNIFGYLEAELIGQSLAILIPHEYRAKHTANLEHSFREGASKILGKRVEMKGLRKDGSIFSLEMKVEEAKGEDDISFFTAAIRDVTERKMAEEEAHKMGEKLRQTQKLESLGVLAGGIAHDFNNILTGIFTNLDLALNHLPSTLPVRGYFEKIEKEAKQAAELCHLMLAYSGRGKFVIKNIDVNELIKEIIQMLNVSVSKKHTIKYDLTENLPPVEVDIAQIHQVIVNLIMNASEAMGENSGVISIITGKKECDNNFLKKMHLNEELPEGLYNFIEVADTGMGMDEETIKKMYDPFFSTKGAGRGLGMSAVLGIIRGHKGLLKVMSKPGEGTKVTILLPPSKKSLSTIKLDNEETPASWRGSGTVLVVDDKESIREGGKSLLEEMGFNVLTASDGQEAVEIFHNRSKEIVCVLLDLTMPLMSGEECFLELRKIRQDIPIIICSGYSEEETTLKFVDQGLSDFLQKPFRLKTIRNKMREIIEKH